MSKDLGNRLKRLRKQLGLYQKDIAQELGVIQKTISNWENGITEPTAEQIIKLAELFDTTPNELQGFDNPIDNKSELERRLIKAGLKDKINNLSDKQYDALITLIDNLIADKNKKN